MFKKLVALIIAFSAAAQLTAFAIPYDEYMAGRAEYTSAAYKISPGLTYTEYLTENEKYGYERSFVYEYTPMQGTTVIPSIGNYVYGTTSLGTITKALEKEGVRVVGGINGDFYSTSTGVPIGAMIIDREIYSSDNDRTAMGFDSDGKAFISKPEIKVKLTCGENEITVEHINKYPLEYSLYLLTDRFYPTTKTTLPSSEIVLMPYTEVEFYETKEDAEKVADDMAEALDKTDVSKDEKEMAEEESDKETEDTEPLEGSVADADVTEEENEAAPEKEPEYFWFHPSEKVTESEKEPSDNEDKAETETAEENKENETESSESSDQSEDGENAEESADPQETEITEDIEESEQSEKTEEIKDSEQTEKTEDAKESEESEAEEELDTNEPADSEEKAPFYAKRYTVSDEKLTVGCEIKVVVKEIRRDSVNSEIPEGCFVICAENLNQLPRVSHIKEGDELTLSISGGEEWYDAVHAIGNTGGLILKDGEYCDDVEIDHYPYAHPRTAAGITADGRVIFYCVDGRQGSSGGLRIDQLSHEMKELGCVIAMNLDGGGSTTAYAALPGEDFSTLKNSPSGIVERKTANSLLFINTTERTDAASRFTFYPERPYVVAGGSSYELPKPAATDINFHPVDLPDDFSYYYYTSPIQTDSYVVDQNKFVSGEKCGPVKVYVHVEQDGQTLEYMAGTVFVLSDISDFSFESEEFELEPFESAELSFTAGYHTAPLFYDKNSLRFSLSAVKEEKEEEKSDEAVEPEKTDDTDKTTENGDDGETEQTTENEENIGETEKEIPEEKKESEKVFVEEKEFFSIPDEGVLENEIGMIDRELVFTPKLQDVSVVFSAKLGQLTKDIVVHVGKYPFIDSFSHWSAKNLYEIYKLDLMQGELVGEELAFVPQRNMTKSEFITVLARMLYPDIDNDKSEVSQLPEEPETLNEAENVLTYDVESEEDFQYSEENAILDQADNDEETEAAEQPADETEEELVTVTSTEPAENGEELAEPEEGEDADTETTEEAEPVYPFADSSDIPEWAEKYYEAMLGSGLLELLVKTDENGTARLYPSDQITRYDVLVMLGALCDEAQEDLLSEYADSNIFDASPHKEYINSAVKAGIFEGYEDKTLRPANLLTRAEAATVILRFYNSVFSFQNE